MTDFYFIKGGPCTPDCLPICDSCKSKNRGAHLPYPTRIAGEYGRGHFTLGQCLNPRSQERQRLALACKPVEVDDWIPLILVPELHTLHDVFVEVATTQELYGPTCNGCAGAAGNMAGLTFEAEARIYDADGVQTGSFALAGPLTSIDASVDAVMRAAVLPAEDGAFVGRGEYVEVGLKVLSLPSAPGITLDKISGMVCVVSHVTDYQYPLHI